MPSRIFFFLQASYNGRKSQWAWILFGRKLCWAGGKAENTLVLAELSQIFLNLGTTSRFLFLSTEQKAQERGFQENVGPRLLRAITLKPELVLHGKSVQVVRKG